MLPLENSVFKKNMLENVELYPVYINHSPMELLSDSQSNSWTPEYYFS